jgi:hypothetical protein
VIPRPDRGTPLAPRYTDAALEVMVRGRRALLVLVPVLLAGCPGRTLPSAPDDGAVSPSPDGGDPCAAEWTCLWTRLWTVCTTEGGLPPGGSDWVCQQERVELDPGIWDGEAYRWSCLGEVPPGSRAPDGCGWTCTLEGTGRYRCEKPDGDAADYPPGGMNEGHCKFVQGPVDCYRCAKGSALDGTQCTLSSSH